MELYEAIYKRKSIRKYSERKLPAKTLAEVSKIVEGVDRLYKDIDLRIYLVEEGQKILKVMSGLVGNLGKIKAPHYLVLTSAKQQGYMENAGYAREDIVLKLTALGIATCWLGGHVRDEDVSDVIGMPENHTAVVMVAFGDAEDKGAIYRKATEDAKRKSLEEISFGEMDRDWLEIMEAVRIAPSAGNSQPWRFYKEGNEVHTYCAKPSNFMTKKLFARINMVDVGIGLHHLVLAAEHLSKPISLEKRSVDSSERGKYIISIVEN